MSISSSNSDQHPADAMNVLLVEDNPGDARLVREAFEETDAEAELHVVTTGEDALAFLAREAEYESAPAPDLVLLDLNLPGKNGEEVLEAVRGEPDLQLLPILVLTSSNSSDDVVQCYEAGANAYLTKPTNPEEFASMVASLERFWFSVVKLPPV